VRGVANPDGVHEARLLLLVGDATAGPVRSIVPREGVTLPEAPERPADRPFRLRILHVNDLHGCVVRHTEHGDLPVLSRMVSRLRALRDQHGDDANSAVLALLGGDNFVGHLLEDEPAAGYQVFSKAGMDVGVLGNHDFDRGAAALAQGIGQGARFPLLSANLIPHPDLQDVSHPAAIFLLNGLRIGLIGLTTRAEIKGCAHIELSNPADAMRNLLPALRPLCDVLIVISHLGHSIAARPDIIRDVGDVELAQRLPKGSVDLIVGGHSHQALNKSSLAVSNVVNGMPIVQAGAHGRFVGEVDLTVQGENVAVTRARLAWTADFPVDEAFEREQVRPLIARMHKRALCPLGRVADHPDLSNDAVRYRIAVGESALMNFITDALVARCRAAGLDVDFAMLDSCCIHAGLPVEGPLTFGDWRQVMPYADTVEVHTVTAEQLQRLLQDNAYRLDRADEPHLERGFLHFSQHVRYQIDLDASRAEARAVKATVGGVTLGDLPERTFHVACTGCIRRQAQAWEEEFAQEHFELLRLEDLPRHSTDLILRNEITAHIEAHGGVTEEGGARRDGRVHIS
jgi:2',3'-cyclic-nucleotide 2'-phosphodiesterase (5'-nucleotidase family)